MVDLLINVLCGCGIVVMIGITAVITAIAYYGIKEAFKGGRDD